MYRNANIDVYLTASRHGEGLGSEAVLVLARYLSRSAVTIGDDDPAAENRAAIRAYEGRVPTVRRDALLRTRARRNIPRGCDGDVADELVTADETLLTGPVLQRSSALLQVSPSALVQPALSCSRLERRGSSSSGIPETANWRVLRSSPRGRAGREVVSNEAGSPDSCRNMDPSIGTCTKSPARCRSAGPS